jgi:hypothetical protein
LEREAQLRRNVGVNGGSAGRAARTAHVHSAALRRGGHRVNGAPVQETEIQYGPGGAPIGTAKLNRYDQVPNNFSLLAKLFSNLIPKYKY